MYAIVYSKVWWCRFVATFTKLLDGRIATAVTSMATRAREPLMPSDAQLAAAAAAVAVIRPTLSDMRHTNYFHSTRRSALPPFTGDHSR